MKNSIRLKIDSSVDDKIKFLCKTFPELEWSGRVFYRVEGTISNPTEMCITCVDLVPLNVGTKTYTSYTWEEERDLLIDYQMENDERLDDTFIGLVHSHNSMRVFFSGEDWDELKTNSPNYDYYLSLIVNNAGDREAKIAIVGTAEPTRFTLKKEQGEAFAIEIPAKEEKIMFTYNCEIEVPKIAVTDEFAAMVSKIIIRHKEKKDKEEEERKAKAIITTGKTPVYQGIGYVRNKQEDYKLYKMREIERNKAGLGSEDSWLQDDNHGLSDPLIYDNLGNDMDERIEEKVQQVLVDTNEEFLCRLLRYGADYNGETVDDTITDIVNAEFEEEQYALTVLEFLPRFYNDFYETEPDNDLHNKQGYSTVLENIGDILMEYNEDVEFVSHLISGIRQILERNNTLIEKLKDERRNKRSTRKI